MILLKLFLTFFKIGAFTFGGGYAMLPLIEEEVIKNNWMDIKQLVNFIAVSESTPGPFAVNTATYIGAELAGLPGAFCATLGVVLPSFIIILIIAKFFMSFCKNKYVSGAMDGLKPAVIGMIGSAIISVAQPVFFQNGMNIDASFISSAVIFILMLILTFRKAHPIVIIALSAFFGVFLGYFFG